MQRLSASMPVLDSMSTHEYQNSGFRQQETGGEAAPEDWYRPGMSGIGKRLREARKAKGLSQAELGEKSGLTQQAIGELEAGRARNSVHTVALARALDVSSTWLTTGEGDARDISRPGKGLVEVEGQEFARLPVYDVRFAAGAGAENYDEEPIDHYLVSISLLRSLTDAPLSMIGIFQANGDSMEPTIANRDWCFVDRRPKKLVNPGIYALSFEGEGLLKRVDRNLATGVVTLLSDNTRYKPQIIKKPERLLVVGRVFLSIRRH